MGQAACEKDLCYNVNRRQLVPFNFSLYNVTVHEDSGDLMK